MATIRKRVRADGSASYQALIVIKKFGEVVHRESQTFARKKLAEDWAKRREIEIQETNVYKRRDRLPVGDVIDAYVERFAPTGKTKKSDLSALRNRDISKLDVHSLKSQDLIKHVMARNLECKPQTAQNDLIWLNAVIKTMRGVIELDTDMSIFESAREVLRKEGMIARSAKRDRRPTKKELWLLSRYFHGKPMLYLIWFAIYSARRLSEICRIEWEDINHDRRTCILRNVKDPRRKGVKKVFKIPNSAYKIIIKHGQRKGRVFPFLPKTIGSYFTLACHALDIKDLHLHDLRHEATSRLFERGLSIVEVQQVTLHENWTTLQRYCNLKPGDLDI